MAFLFTPGQLVGRSELYHQLGSSLSAGLPLVETFRILARNPPARGLTGPLHQVHRRLQSGATLAESLASLGKWVPEFDLALMEAGEQSGRMDHVCRLLSKSYHDRAALARQVLSGLAYPVFVFHFAFLIMPIRHLVQLFHGGDFATFVLSKLAIFAPLWLVAGLVIYALQGTRAAWWRATLEGVTSALPVVGRAQRALVLSRASMALDALLNAGVNMTRSWALAARASGSPALERVVARWTPRIESGDTVSELMQRSSFFPPHFTSIYSSGEMSGRIDEALPRLAEHYQDEGLRRMRISANLLTGAIYGAVLLIGAWQIISFWVGFYGQMLAE